MKKIIIITAAILSLITASYCGLWFYGASKIESEITKYVNDSNYDIEVGDIDVSGFPLSRNITIKDLKVELDDDSEILLDHVSIKGSPFSTNFEVEKISDITFKDLPISYKIFTIRPGKGAKFFIKADSDKNNILVDYIFPSFEILDKDKNILFSSKIKNQKSSLTFGDKIIYRHKDSGSVLLDPKGNILSSTDSTMFDISFAQKSSKDIEFTFKADIKNSKKIDVPGLQDDLLRLQKESNLSKESKLKHMGDIKVSFELNTSSNPGSALETVFSLQINDFEIENKDFGFSLKGNVKNTKKEIIPSGKLLLKLRNFDYMVEELKTNINEEFAIRQQQNDPKLTNIMSQIDEISLIMKSLGNQNSQSSTNMLIFDMNRVEGSLPDLSINEQSLMQLIVAQKMRKQNSNSK